MQTTSRMFPQFHWLDKCGVPDAARLVIIDHLIHELSHKSFLYKINSFAI